ncbi:hypothetical protein GCM10011504_48790 [Siccirubricoccus deserti]|nr:hypothetical protein GCM10011504_48790 [Siccirubricoccus deserti]
MSDITVSPSLQIVLQFNPSRAGWGQTCLRPLSLGAGLLHLRAGGTDYLREEPLLRGAEIG